MKKLFLALGVFVLCVVINAQAGECPQGTEFYFKRLSGETVKNSSYYTPSQCFYCLGVPRKRFLRWGVVSEKAPLFSMRELEYRDRLVEHASSYLLDPETQLAAATVLAYQGVLAASGCDVFEILVQNESKVRQPWYTFAALKDPRVVGHAERRYNEIRGESKTVDTRMRQRLSDIVDCLFHLNLSESSKLLAKLADQEQDSGLVEYIQSVSGG